MKTFLLILLSIFILAPEKTHAYIDPGTGSYLVQILFGVLFGSLFTIKTFWTQIKSYVLKIIKKEPSTKNESTEKPTDQS